MGIKDEGMQDGGRQDIELMAHLMRRAGFGATQAEIEERVEKRIRSHRRGSCWTPGDAQWLGEFIVRRFDLEASGMINYPGSARRWLYRMVTSDAPLAGEDDALLARHLRYGHAEGHQRQGAIRSGGYVQALRDGQVRQATTGTCEEPGDDCLAGQPGQSQGRHQRELGTRTAWSCSRWVWATTLRKT